MCCNLVTLSKADLCLTLKVYVTMNILTYWDGAKPSTKITTEAWRDMSLLLPLLSTRMSHCSVEQTSLL